MGQLPTISDQGFRRIAQAAPAQQPAPDLARLQQDIESMRGWIDYLANEQLATEDELAKLTQKVDFLESHLYDVGGKEEPATPVKTLDVTPFTSPYDTGMQDYEEYVKTLPYPPAGY